MKIRGSRVTNSTCRFIYPPAYPFTGTQLLEDLRCRIAKEQGHAVGFQELGQYIGQPKSTAHFWLSAYRHPHLLALMTLLERISPSERHSFMESYCRPFPLLSQACLVGQIAKLRALLTESTGLTVIKGSTEWARSFVLTAFGHSWRRCSSKRDGPSGIDIHNPTQFVPVETLRYIDEGLEREQLRDLVLSIWPRVITSRSELFLGNRLWSSVPEVRDDLLRVTKHKHVILAEESMATFSAFTNRLPDSTCIVTLSQPSPAGRSIRISCQQLKSPE